MITCSYCVTTRKGVYHADLPASSWAGIGSEEPAVCLTHCQVLDQLHLETRVRVKDKIKKLVVEKKKTVSKSWRSQRFSSAGLKLTKANESTS